MRRLERAPWPFLLCSLVLLGACSLIVNLDPEGLPCDDLGGCREGFLCVEGVCQAEGDACGGCPAGQQCDELTGQCVGARCEELLCPAGTACELSDGRASCVVLQAPRLGHSCLNDSQCETEGGGERICYRGAIQTSGSSGALRPGICVELCTPEGSCASPGASCEAVAVGSDGGASSLCLTPGLVTSCAGNTDCARGNLVCTVYDHPRVGPTTLCDQPLATGVAPGAACVAVLAGSDGGSFCQNGLCVPRNPTALQEQRCGEPCGDCGSAVCAPVEFDFVGVIRHIPMCVPQTTQCRSCAADAGIVCGADAPACVSTSVGRVCLASCTPDAGTFAECPAGTECTLVGARHRCVPPGGC